MTVTRPGGYEGRLEDPMQYPTECFSKNETRTARNLQAYEKWLDKIYAECFCRRPDYAKLSLRERYAVRHEVIKDIPFML